MRIQTEMNYQLINSLKMLKFSINVYEKVRTELN